MESLSAALPIVVPIVVVALVAVAYQVLTMLTGDVDFVGMSTATDSRRTRRLSDGSKHRVTSSVPVGPRSPTTKNGPAFGRNPLR